MGALKPIRTLQRADVRNVDYAIRIACLALLAYGTAIVIRPLAGLIGWSIILLVLLYPAFRWTTTRLRLNRAIAALLISTVCMLVLLGPATWLGLSLATSLRSLAQRLGSGDLMIPPPFEPVKRLPLIGDKIYELWHLASTNLRAALIQIAPQLRPISSRLLFLAGNAGIGMLEFMGAIAMTSFLFIPAPSLAKSTRQIVSRLGTGRGDEFIDLVGSTIRNLARGVIGVAMAQALLAGIGLIVAGVPGAGLISLLVLILGIIQIGSAIVIVPVLIWCFLSMSTMAAILLATYLLPVSLMDNFLRPLIMSRGLKTPMLVILIGLIGGALAYGLIGLFLGPIVLAVAWELLALWSKSGEDVPIDSVQVEDSASPQSARSPNRVFERVTLRSIRADKFGSRLSRFAILQCNRRRRRPVAPLVCGISLHSIERSCYLEPTVDLVPQRNAEFQESLLYPFIPQLIVKLRWIGQDEEAKELEAAAAALPAEERCGVSFGPFSTD